MRILRGLGLLSALGFAGSGDPRQLQGQASPVDSAIVAGWTEQDWQVLQAKVRWGVANGLDTLPLGDAIARLGLSFVGTPYRPGTLEMQGPEHLVINLREFDCVTFIENVLALVRFIRLEGTAGLTNRSEAEARYGQYLTRLRYRSGTISGYASRLHYFSEWLGDNERRGTLKQLSHGLGGVADSDPLFFMSSHASAYPQLSDPAMLAAVQDVEASLNRGPPRFYIPAAAIDGISDQIRSGDIIAATTTIDGLDVVHTGFAVWQQGELHLLHAPLVGTSVEISLKPLGDRIRSQRAQDGIMVARPTEDPSKP